MHKTTEAKVGKLCVRFFRLDRVISDGSRPFQQINPRQSKQVEYADAPVILLTQLSISRAIFMLTKQ